MYDTRHYATQSPLNILKCMLDPLYFIDRHLHGCVQQEGYTIHLRRGVCVQISCSVYHINATGILSAVYVGIVCRHRACESSCNCLH